LYFAKALDLLSVTLVPEEEIKPTSDPKVARRSTKKVYVKMTEESTEGLTDFQLREYTKYKVDLILKVRLTSSHCLGIPWVNIIVLFALLRPILQTFTMLTTLRILRLWFINNTHY